MLLESFLVAAAVLGIFRNLVLTWANVNRLPKSIPWIGRRDQYFSRIRACGRELFGSLERMNAGYKEYSKRGKCFVLPDPGLRPQVMVPPEYTKWVTEQPENVLTAHKPLRDMVALSYISPTSDPKHDMYIMDVIRKDVTRSLVTLQPDIIHDLRESVDRLFGTDTENWRSVPLYSTMVEIFFKSSNRMFVGEPLCNNKIFLRSSALFSNFMGAGTVLVGEYLPLVLKPIFGYPLAMPIYLAKAVAFRYLIPEIKRRMVNIRLQRADTGFEWDPPRDMLMWVVIAAMNRQDPKADRPEAIGQGMLFLMLGAIQTTILTATNVFLDLLSSPPSSDYYEHLRAEINSILHNDQEWESQAAIAKLHCTDSAIRESLRRSPVLTRTGMREVVKTDGVTLPNGEVVPNGAWLAIPAMAIHYDERFYPSPEKYDPFRFIPDEVKGIGNVDPTAPMPKSTENEHVSAQEPKQRLLPTSLSSASPTFLGFGYGRHSCPGRWFVALQLKLLIAYIISHYDIERLEKRPLHRIIGSHCVSPSVTIKVKRRKGTS